jgi:hypothetical protein
MAVSSAGMLVRRDVWDQAGGFDPAMPLLRDDVDFCWRVHAAGHRVRVVTDAVVYHLEATARNRRTPSAAPRPRRMDRHNALLTLLANLPLWPALSALAGNLVLSVLRTVFFLLAKRPRAALDEFTGVGSVLAHPLQLAGPGGAGPEAERAAYSRLRGDLPSAAPCAWRSSPRACSVDQIDTAGSHRHGRPVRRRLHARGQRARAAIRPTRASAGGRAHHHRAGRGRSLCCRRGHATGGALTQPGVAWRALA